MKLCISCGMPMEKAEDFPFGDTTKDYCVHCARPDGSHAVLRGEGRRAWPPSS